jgi:hypothetical protein
MGNNKAPVFTLTIVAIIVGVALFKQVDFKNFKVENVGLSIIYLITFVGSVYVLIKNRRNQPKK